MEHLLTELPFGPAEYPCELTMDTPHNTSLLNCSRGWGVYPDLYLSHRSCAEITSGKLAALPNSKKRRLNSQFLMKVTFSFPAPWPKYWLSMARYVGSCWGEHWGSWIYQGTCQPWGAAAAALARRCDPVILFLGNGGYFPQNQKFILLCTVRVYTLFLNREFPELGKFIVSASKQCYVYTHENPNKYFSLLLAVYVLTYMIWKLTSIIFLVTSRESKDQRARRGSPIYCRQTSQADTGYVC